MCMKGRDSRNPRKEEKRIRRDDGNRKTRDQGEERLGRNLVGVPEIRETKIE